MQYHVEMGRSKPGPKFIHRMIYGRLFPKPWGPSN